MRLQKQTATKRSDDDPKKCKNNHEDVPKVMK